MNKIKKTIILLTLFFCSSLIAQTSTTFSVGELSPYFSEYLKPVTLGVATGMGSGWAHEAKPHNTLGFDVSFTATVVQFPSGGLTFDNNALSSMKNDGYSLLKDGNVVTNSATGIPSMASSDKGSSYSLQKTINSGFSSDPETVEFDLLDGLDIPFVPNLAIQAAVGLPKNTEVMVRFIPDMSSSINNVMGSNDVSVDRLNMWGLGVKHDLKQWIPVLSRIPIIQLSAMVAYSQFNLDVNLPDIDLQPENIYKGTSTISYEGEADDKEATWKEHGFDMEMSSLVGSIMIGANIPVFKPYIGVGFNRASINTGLTGNLPKITYVDATNIKVEIDEKGLRIDQKKTFANFQAGFNIKLAVFNIYAQYTLQEYSMFSGGIAFGFR